MHLEVRVALEGGDGDERLAARRAEALFRAAIGAHRPHRRDEVGELFARRPEELWRQVSATLVKAGIEHGITGAAAAALHGVAPTAIPLTTVGKIYKPQLRCDAAQRLVARLVTEQLAIAGARVQVNEGGRRGLRVSVTLPEKARLSAPAVEQALAGFLFEAEVVVG